MRSPFAGLERLQNKVQRPAKKLKNVRFATPKWHGTARQIAPSKKHPSPCFNSMAVKGGRLLEGPLGRGPFAGFETLIEQGSKASHKAQNVRFATPKRHGTVGQIVPSKKQPSQWMTECFAPLPGRKALSSPQLGKKHPSPRFNSMAVKDGRLLKGPPGRGPFAGFETPIEQGSKASQKAKNVRFAMAKRHGTAGQIVPSKKDPSPCFNSMAVRFSKGCYSSWPACLL